MDKHRRSFLVFSLFAVGFLCEYGSGLARDVNRPSHFLPEERRAIEDYYRQGSKGKAKGLPPGLAKRGGKLPPGVTEAFGQKWSIAARLAEATRTVAG